MFRILFFTFTLLLLLLLLSLIWMAWKIYPLLKPYGGFKELFRPHSIKTEKLEEKTDKVEEVVKEEIAAKEKPTNQGLVDEDIDES